MLNMPINVQTQKDATLHEIKFYPNTLAHKEEELSYLLRKVVENLTWLNTENIFTMFNTCSGSCSAAIYNRNLSCA